MTSTGHIQSLNGVRLAPDALALRRFTHENAANDPDHLAHYDRRTLFYHAFIRADLKQLILIAPPFYNLWAEFRATLRINGAPVQRCHRRKTRHCDILTIPLRTASSVTLSGEGWSVDVPVADMSRFAGLNVMMAINKDNHLDWIVDWARFHVSSQNVQGIILFDNNSDHYEAEEIVERLIPIAGLERLCVVGATFPYGPRGTAKYKVKRPTKFLQSSMLNLARALLLARARAVLSIDIDELVLAKPGQNIFDAANAHPLGLVTMHGQWALPNATHEGIAHHRDHVFRKIDAKRGARKWCATPNGFIARHWPWHMHQMGGALQNWFTESSTFRYAHCWSISTGWKKQARLVAQEGVRFDAELDEVLQRHLP